MTSTDRLPVPGTQATGTGRYHRPRMLDLYSCAGLGGDGYASAGFDVTGVDIRHQPHYPNDFIQADVLTLDPEWIATFDVVHASPPCQRYTELRHLYVSNDHPDLIAPTRELLKAAGRPYVIENVEDARPELIDPVMLCGLMFPGLRVFRHRLFETLGFSLDQPLHQGHRGIVCHTFDKRKRQYGRTDEMRDFVTVTGGGNCTVAAAADAMGVAHRTELTKQELNEGIPPAFTRYLGAALMAHIREVAA